MISALNSIIAGGFFRKISSLWNPPKKSCHMGLLLYTHSSYGVEVFIFLWIYTQSVGLLGRVISPAQGLYLNIGQQKQNKRMETHQTSMP
jgi:hypothetical protein